MKRSRVLLLGTLLLVPVLALSNDSLWIDEGNSALKAMQPSLSAWWGKLISEGGSDLQMPLYMFYLWCWEKIAGYSELALRAANLPWFFLAQYSFYRLCRRSDCSPWLLLAVASVSPFLWFYLNEARPYLMQYAGACMVLCGLGELLLRRDNRMLIGGIILLAASSLLGMLWSASAILSLLFIYYHQRRFPGKRDVAWLAGLLVALGLLGSFYLWGLLHGGRGSAVGKMTAANLAYVLFELLGFAGLGPGRLELRETTIASLSAFAPSLLGLLVVLLVVLGASLRVLRLSAHRLQLKTGLIYGLTATLLLVLPGFAANFRLLGRHFTPLSPLLFLAIAIGIAQLTRTRWKAVGMALLVLWLASSLSLRFAPRHRKDDYRNAAAEARLAMAAKKIVWWSADSTGARYYQLPLGQPNLIVVINPTTEKLQQLLRPDVIILSKADIFDANAATRTYLKTEGFQLARTLPAFTVWQR